MCTGSLLSFLLLDSPLLPLPLPPSSPFPLPPPLPLPLPPSTPGCPAGQYITQIPHSACRVPTTPTRPMSMSRRVRACLHSSWQPVMTQEESALVSGHVVRHLALIMPALLCYAAMPVGSSVSVYVAVSNLSCGLAFDKIVVCCHKLM